MCLPQNPEASNEYNPPKLKGQKGEHLTERMSYAAKISCYFENPHYCDGVLSNATQTVLYIASSLMSDLMSNPVHMYRILAYDYSREEMSLILLENTKKEVLYGG